MHIEPALLSWLNASDPTRPDPFGIDEQARLDLIAEIEGLDEGESLRTAEGEGHPFHGNQYTGQTAIHGTPDATALIRQSLNRLPDAVRRESNLKEIHASSNPTDLAAKIDAYTLKHYGFSSEASAKGLVDRERGVMYTLTDPHETYTQFAHTLTDRIQSPAFKKVVRDHPLPVKRPEDAFSRYFADSFTNVASLGDPASAVYDLFKLWGWR